MSSSVRLLILLGILAGIGFGGIIYLAQAVEPPVRAVDKVLPDDQFPR